ncbi:MAG: hypothetical protein M3040_06600 [Bacteroidota bacterium]|nr:hypothetical protein [Bacteroidota bacterium]
MLFLIIDFIGYVSFAMPGTGELSDVIFAPIFALIFYKLFGGWKEAFGGLFNFAEEILPFTDFIPTFAIMWVWQYVTKRKHSNVLSRKASVG